MRSLVRYLPATLILLLPLVALAVFGSLELSRQQERAETFLRGRALDFLDEATHDFDHGLASYLVTLLDQAFGNGDPTDSGSLIAQAQSLQASAPALLELVQLDADGDFVHPRPAPREVLMTSGVLIEAQTLIAADDLDGARDHLREWLDRPHDRDSSARPRALLLLASLERRHGEAKRAAELAQQALASTEAAIAEAESGNGRRERRERFFPGSSSGEPRITELMATTLQAELQDQAAHSVAARLRLAQQIAAGEYQGVTDGLLTATFDRLVEAGGNDEEVAGWRRSLWHLIAGRHLSRHCGEALGRGLSERLTKAGPRGLELFVIDAATGAQLLAVRREGGAKLAPVAWQGCLIDLTTYLNHALSPRLAAEKGFTLDVRTPNGESVLNSPHGDGEQTSGGFVARSVLTQIEFRAAPRNAREQIESRRVSTRNRALLVVALCLLAVGGAILLVRSVSRESELAAMKVDLVSRVSHELKTPLSMIKMYGETLSLGRARDSAEVGKFSSIILREADRLGLLIERILDFSRRQAGQLSYQPRATDLSALVSRSAEQYRALAEATGMKLRAEVEPELWAEVDPEAAASALVNLLENAIKYTPATATDRTVDVELRRSGEQAVLEVRDRGVGIPPEELESVFHSFYRASTAGQVRGAGLGLSLVQHFAQAHRGEVAAVCRDGGGTTFRLSLPLCARPSKP